MSRRRALLVSSDKYVHFEPLDTPENDVAVLMHLLADPNIGDFDECQPLTDEPSETVRRNIEAFFTRAEPDDLLVLYISGHGLKRRSGGLSFPMVDSDPDYESSTVNADYINRQLRESPAMSAVVFLDCCFAGLFSRDLAPKADETKLTLDEFGAGLVTGLDRALGVLAASTGTTYAYPAPTAAGKVRRHLSTFTEVLTEGLRTGDADLDGDGIIDFDELKSYVATHVPRRLPGQRPDGAKIGLSALPIAGTRSRRVRTSRVVGRDSPTADASSDSPQPRSLLRELITAASLRRLSTLREDDLGITPVPNLSWRSAAPLRNTDLRVYAPRPEQDDALRSAMTEGSIVLAVGPPRSGKSRSLFEAAKSALPNYVAVVPSSPYWLERIAGALLDGADIPRRFALWLDEFDQYLSPGGLYPELVSRLLARFPDALIIGTMRDREYRRYTAVQRDIGWNCRTVLSRATVVDIPRILTSKQLSIARSLFQADVSAALAEDLSGAVEQAAHWEQVASESPATASLVNAVLDWCRAGLVQPMPLTDLKRLWLRYRPESSTAVAPAATDEFDRALRLALSKSNPERALLSEYWDAGRAFRVPTYLIDLADARDENVPDGVWTDLARHARPRQALAVGFHAYTRGRLDAAISCWELALDAARSAEATFLLACGLLERSSRDDNDFHRATALLREAAALADPPYSPRAGLRLGSILSDAGDIEGASAALQDVVASNDSEWKPRAAFELGVVRAESRDFQAAIESLELARDAGHKEVSPRAALELGRALQHYANHVSENPAGLDAHQLLLRAAACFREAMSSRHPDVAPEAALALGLLLARQNDFDGALTALEVAWKANAAGTSARANYEIAVLLDTHGPRTCPLGDVPSVDAPATAEARYRSTVAYGDAEWSPRAAFALGKLLLQRGAHDDALEILSAAATSNHPEVSALAAVEAARIHIDRGEEDVGFALLEMPLTLSAEQTVLTQAQLLLARCFVSSANRSAGTGQPTSEHAEKACALLRQLIGYSEARNDVSVMQDVGRLFCELARIAGTSPEASLSLRKEAIAALATVPERDLSDGGAEVLSSALGDACRDILTIARSRAGKEAASASSYYLPVAGWLDTLGQSHRLTAKACSNELVQVLCSWADLLSQWAARPEEPRGGRRLIGSPASRSGIGPQNPSQQESHSLFVRTVVASSQWADAADILELSSCLFDWAFSARKAGRDREASTVFEGIARLLQESAVGSPQSEEYLVAAYQEGLAHWYQFLVAGGDPRSSTALSSAAESFARVTSSQGGALEELAALGLARVDHMRGDVREAQRVYGRLAESPDSYTSAASSYLLGRLLQHEGDWKAARHALGRAAAQQESGYIALVAHDSLRYNAVPLRWLLQDPGIQWASFTDQQVAEREAKRKARYQLSSSLADFVKMILALAVAFGIFDAAALLLFSLFGSWPLNFRRYLPEWRSIFLADVISVAALGLATGVARLRRSLTLSVAVSAGCASLAVLAQYASGGIRPTRLVAPLVAAVLAAVIGYPMLRR